MNYNELFKSSLNNDIFNKDKIFNNILSKIKEDELEEKLSVLLLLLLQRKDNYGFKLIDELNILLKNELKNKEGTIYPILHLLEEMNYIESYWCTEETNKKYYKISNAGKKHLKEKESIVNYLKSPNKFIYTEEFSWI